MTAHSAPSPRRLLPAAVLLAGAGLAAGCAVSATAPIASTRSPAAFACALDMDQSGRMVAYQGRLQASEAVSGSYSLTVAGGGTNIAQVGPFSARPGETVTLGQATLAGPPGRYDADLSITVNGTTVNCASNPGSS